MRASSVNHPFFQSVSQSSTQSIHPSIHPSLRPSVCPCVRPVPFNMSGPDQIILANNQIGSTVKFGPASVVSVLNCQSAPARPLIHSSVVYGRTPAPLDSVMQVNIGPHPSIVSTASSIIGSIACQTPVLRSQAHDLGLHIISILWPQSLVLLELSKPTAPGNVQIDDKHVLMPTPSPMVLRGMVLKTCVEQVVGQVCMLCCMQYRPRQAHRQQDRVTLNELTCKSMGSCTSFAPLPGYFPGRHHNGRAHQSPQSRLFLPRLPADPPPFLGC